MPVDQHHEGEGNVGGSHEESEGGGGQRVLPMVSRAIPHWMEKDMAWNQEDAKQRHREDPGFVGSRMRPRVNSPPVVPFTR